MKIALVHEFLNQYGGAERVLENFLEIWPDATIHVIFYDAKKTDGRFKKYPKKISSLDSWPFAHKHPRLFLTKMPGAIESFKFNDFDVVISDSSSFAKGAMTNKLHICYCHTPTRFLWTENDYLEKQRYPWLLRFFGGIALPRIRQWDFRAAQRPNFYIANSYNVQQRIKKYYKRDSIIIPPPVNTDFFSAEGGSALGGKPIGRKQNYFLAAARLEPYKKLDLIVEAFNELGLPLKVAGDGTIADQLRTKAKKNIEFVGKVNDEQLRDLYSGAQAYVFAAEEDAGITLLEAQACGTPVIAYGAGGALESVVSGKTGEFFKEQTVTAIVQAVKNFDRKKYDSNAIREQAKKFDKQVFQKKIKDFVEEKYAHRT